MADSMTSSETKSRWASLASLRWQCQVSTPLVVACTMTTLFSAAGLAMGIVGLGRLGSALFSTNAPAAWTWLAVIVCSALGVNLASSVLEFFSSRLGALTIAHAHDTIAHAALTPDQITHLENAETAGELSSLATQIREYPALRGVPAMWTVISARLSGLVGFAIVAAWSPLAAVLLLGGHLLVSAAFGRYLVVVQRDLASTQATARRRADYFRLLNLTPPPAKEVRLFGLASWSVGCYTHYWRIAMVGIWARRNRALAWALLSSVALLVASAISIWLLVRDVIAGFVGVGTLISIVQGMAGFAGFGPLGDDQSYAKRFGITTRQADDLNSRLADSGPDHPSVIADSTNAVAISHLRFGYPGTQHEIFTDFSLVIPKGQHIAIVGENGAGKSTLIKLICNLYRPDAGEIALGGRPLVVLQDYIRYPLTLAENVLLGEDDGQAPRLDCALTSAAASPVVEQLPQGPGTPLSSAFAGGVDLSGGQWQRIAIARALAALGEDDMLILDEPTASLDIRTEVEIFEHLMQVTSETTTILVSHRLSSVRRADRIIVIEDGRIVEDGNHDSLMRAGGIYATMFDLQARRYLEGE